MQNKPGNTGSKNNAFVQALLMRAKEQHNLQHQLGMPNKFGFINTWLVDHGLIKVMEISFFISIVLFTVFFDWFYAVEHVIAGK